MVQELARQIANKRLKVAATRQRLIKEEAELDSLLMLWQAELWKLVAAQAGLPVEEPAKSKVVPFMRNFGEVDEDDDGLYGPEGIPF